MDFNLNHYRKITMGWFKIRNWMRISDIQCKWVCVGSCWWSQNVLETFLWNYGNCYAKSLDENSINYYASCATFFRVFIPCFARTRVLFSDNFFMWVSEPLLRGNESKIAPFTICWMIIQFLSCKLIGTELERNSCLSMKSNVYLIITIDKWTRLRDI